MRRLAWVAVGVVVVVALGVTLPMLLPGWFWHPLGQCSGRNCLGYQFWSGLVGDIGEVTLPVALIGWCVHHNCREKGCWKVGHRHPGHGQPMCSRHYYKTPSGLRRHHGLPLLWADVVDHREK